MISTDWSVIFSLAHPNMAFLFSPLFCICILNLQSTVTLRYFCQNCHFLNHRIYFVTLFLLNILTLRRVSDRFFLSLGSQDFWWTLRPVHFIQVYQIMETWEVQRTISGLGISFWWSNILWYDKDILVQYLKSLQIPARETSATRHSIYVWKMSRCL